MAKQSKKSVSQKTTTTETVEPGTDRLREMVKTIVEDLLNSGDFEFDIEEADINTKTAAALDAMKAQISRLQQTVAALCHEHLQGKADARDAEKAAKPGRLDVTKAA